MTSAQDVAFTYSVGLMSTMSSAPIIHPFNVIAASAARTQLTSGKAAVQVYAGLGSHSPNSILNFWNGLLGHLSKELVRSVGRIMGVVYIERDFKERFSPVMAPHALASVMAMYEVIFANPADVWKSFRSTGLKTTVPDLFKGSIGNFARQYGMWYVWSLTTPIINKQIEASGMDAKSGQAVAIRSVLQSAACTSVTYPLELLLRTVQVRSDQYPVKNFSQTAKFIPQALANPSLIAKESAYVRVFSDLVRLGGIRGIGLGMGAKFIGNSVLLMNANYLPILSEYISKKVMKKGASS